MKLAILDDYMKVALASADWEGVRRRGVEITVFDTAFASVDDAAAKLAPFEIVNLLRERTHFTRALIERLPNLRFIAMTGRRAPSLDIAAATERRIPVSNTHGGEGGASTSEMAWTLLLAAARDLANAERGVRAGRWHEGVRAGHRARGAAPRRGRPRPAGQPRGGLRQGVRHGRRGVEPEPHGGARGRVRRAPREQGGALLDLGFHQHPRRAERPHPRPHRRGRLRAHEAVARYWSTPRAGRSWTRRH